MLVTRDSFASVLSRLWDAEVLALDTETTGLRPYHGSELFSLGVYGGAEAYYFNWNEYSDVVAGDPRVLGAEHLFELGQCLGMKKRKLYYHNAKFDMAMLAQHNIHPAGEIHDTMIVARILDSTLFPNQFSLDYLAGAIGHKKDDAVKTWLLKNKGYTERTATGKKGKKKDLHYALVPLDLIQPYCEQDTRITWELAESQEKRLLELDAQMKRDGMPATVMQVFENEKQLTRTVYDMERTGVRIDRAFCEKAAKAADFAREKAEGDFELLTNLPFKDSTLTYQKAFAGDRERWVFGKPTATGKVNPSFDSDVLETFESPAAAAVLAWRKAKSDANYYHGFLDAADASDAIHTNFNQHATATGRFSSSEPNLQNLTKTEDEALAEQFVVRRAIVPRPGMVFHMLDFRQMEYRLMLDYAARYAGGDKEGVLALIAKVLEGLDVHQATADVARCSRKDAKTVNFATLYGSGVANLASRLACTEHRARDLRDSIFRACPETLVFIRRATGAAEKRGYVCNWFGRRCQFPDARYSYRAPNHLIQGGCADVVKVAMNRIHQRLENWPGVKTRMVLQVHDEIVLEGPPEEAAEVVPVVQEIMETVYPHKFVPLLCDVEHSFKSLADKAEGIARWR